MREARIEALEAMLAQDPGDTFALYGLALEYRAVERADEAESLLRRLLVADPDQLYGYYQLGELLLSEDRPADARAILDQGLARARAAGDAKAAGELAALRAQIE